MSFKVIGYYKKVTKITFENELNEEIVFNDYDAAKRFVKNLKEDWVYDRYIFQIVNVEGLLVVPSKKNDLPLCISK